MHTILAEGVVGLARFPVGDAQRSAVHPAEFSGSQGISEDSHQAEPNERVAGGSQQAVDVVHVVLVDGGEAGATVQPGTGVVRRGPGALLLRDQVAAVAVSTPVVRAGDRRRCFQLLPQRGHLLPKIGQRRDDGGCEASQADVAQPLRQAVSNMLGPGRHRAVSQQQQDTEEHRARHGDAEPPPNSSRD